METTGERRGGPRAWIRRRGHLIPGGFGISSRLRMIVQTGLRTFAVHAPANRFRDLDVRPSALGTMRCRCHVVGNHAGRRWRHRERSRTLAGVNLLDAATLDDEERAICALKDQGMTPLTGRENAAGRSAAMKWAIRFACT